MEETKTVSKLLSNISTGNITEQNEIIFFWVETRLW